MRRHKTGFPAKRWIVVSLILFALLVTGHRGIRAQEGVHQAGLVIRYGDDRVETHCVAFTEPEISGLELLRRSGVSLVVDPSQSWGVAVCKIGDTGCDYPHDPCFCQCQGDPCVYWAYYHLQGGQWVYSEVSASQYRVRHGMVEGWSWGKGLPGQGTPPPVISFAEICRSPAQNAGASSNSERPLPVNLGTSVLPVAALLVALLASGWLLGRRRR